MRCFGAINNGCCRLAYSHRRLCARIGIVSLVVLYAKRLFIRRNVLRSVGRSREGPSVIVVVVVTIIKTGRKFDITLLL